MILAMDTSTQVGSVAIVDRERVIASRYFDIGMQHSKRLFTEIEQLCQLVNCMVADFTAIGVTVGPGSFTGVRIGLAAAKGLCLIDDKPLIAVSTLAALAAGVPCISHPVCALLDARKEQVYAGLYDVSGGSPLEISPARAIEPQALVEERSGKSTVFVGSGAEAYATLIDETPGSQRVPFHANSLHAAAVGALAWFEFDRGNIADLSTVEPDYLRAPDAKVSIKSGPAIK